MKKLFVIVIVVIGAALLINACGTTGASSGDTTGGDVISRELKLAFNIYKERRVRNSDHVHRFGGDPDMPRNGYIAWSSDGSKLVYGIPSELVEDYQLEENRVVIWDMASARVVSSWKASFMSEAEKRYHTGKGMGRMSMIAYSSDTGSIALGIANASTETGGLIGPGGIRTFEAASGKPIAVFSYDFQVPTGRTLLAYSPDNRNILALYQQGFDILNSDSLEDIKSLDERPDYTAYSPDSKTIAGTIEDFVVLLDAASGEVLGNIPGKNGSVLAYNSDGTLLAMGSKDGEVTLFDTKTNSELLAFEGLKTCIVAVAVSPGNERIMAIDQAGILKVWDIKSGKEIQSFPTGYRRSNPRRTSELYLHQAFSPDGTRIAMCYYGVVQVWDIASGQRASLAYFDEGKWAAITDFGNSWNTEGHTNDFSLVTSVAKDGKETPVKTAQNNVETLAAILSGKTGVAFKTPDEYINPPQIITGMLASGTYLIGGPTSNLHLATVSGSQLSIPVKQNVWSGTPTKYGFEKAQLTDLETGTIYFPSNAREKDYVLTYIFKNVRGGHFTFLIPSQRDPYEIFIDRTTRQ